MLLKDSRYASARRFAPREGGSLPFKGLRPRPIGTATPVVEHVLQTGERFDGLGQHYFNDPRLWWRILDANADVLCAAELELPGLPPLRRPSGQGPAAPKDETPSLGETLLVPRAKE